MIVIIDYKVGNLQSVQAAFKRLGMETVVSRDHQLIRQAKALVLPGVGAFPTAMSNLEAFDLIDILNERAAAGVLILGICLGMQVLFEKGTENGETTGLGFLKGTVNLISTEEKLPHMGWNQLHLTGNHPLTQKIQEHDEVYFVHSYAADCPTSEILASTDYGNTQIPAIVGKDNVMGCQFHPEKSGKIGQLILTAFKEMIECL